MFDGIIFNHRIFGSMVDQARTSVARTAPGAEHVREQMEIRTAPFPLKNDLLFQMVNSLPSEQLLPSHMGNCPQS